MTNDMDEILKTFKIESLEYFDSLSIYINDLKASGKSIDKKTINKILRILHSLKGNSATVGFYEFSKLVHTMEEIFKNIQQGYNVLDNELLNALLVCIISLTQILEGKKPLYNYRECQKLLTVYIDTSIGISFSNTQKEDGENNDSEAGIEKNQINLSDNRYESLAEIRVKASRLNKLMDHTEELLVAQALLSMNHEFRQNFYETLLDFMKNQSKNNKQQLTQVIENIEQLIKMDYEEYLTYENLTQKMSQAIKSIRLMPLHTLTPLARRVVLESSQTLGKNVQLVMDVGDIELDKHILDILRTPFVHMLRNSVSHGIESEKVRRVNGKNVVGTITVSATFQGAFVDIIISDDGQGIDQESVMSTAKSKGFLSENKLSQMSDAEIKEIIFAAGFSTIEDISEVAGRGIGLDVAKRQIEELGGTIGIIHSDKKQGTAFKISLPVSLISIQGLLIQVGQSICAIPIDYIERSIRIKAEDIVSIDNHPVFRSEDLEPVRLRDLSTVLGQRPTRKRTWEKILILHYNSKKLGLIVDDILFEQEFVVRQLPWNVKKIPDINGVVSLPDGSLAIAIDIPNLFSKTTNGQSQNNTKSILNHKKLKILVVDDSLTARTLMKNALQSHGHEVITTVDGKEAWQHLDIEKIDLVVTDIQMPKMDGFELTKKIRQSPKLKNLPVILISNLHNSHDIEKGLAIGADEYIVKGEFESDKLLDAVSRLF